MLGSFKISMLLIVSIVAFCYNPLQMAASFVIDQPEGLPDGFVAGLPLTEQEFNTPISKLQKAGLLAPDKLPPCSVTVRQSKLAKNAITSTTQRWPNNRIPYVISAAFSASDRNVIACAMNEYILNTCITFVSRTTEADYIVISPAGNGCSSYVGRVGGAQTVSLDPGCVYHYIVIHELMHAAGFQHEQGRTDRDDYVNINWSNIQSGYAFAFDKYSSANVQLLGTLYDTKSVLHYQSNAFAINPSIATIFAKDGSQLGNTAGFSSNDILKLKRLYGCNAADTCWDDEIRNCPSLVASGWCSSKPQEMIARCRKSCGFCNQPVCLDDNANCGYWADNGECTKSAAYMNTYCKRACRTCTFCFLRF